jgi:hypothetical protein
MRNYYLANPDKLSKRTPEQQSEYNRLRREKYKQCSETRDKAKAKVKEWQERNPDKRKSQRIKKFGISLDQFTELYERCGGKCEICGFKDDGNKSFFPFIDHCHTTGKVRGLLCSKCNFGIGHFNDDIGRMRKAIAYIESKSAD